MESTLDPATAQVLLQWHLDAGADEAISDAPIDRYALEAKPVEKAKPAAKDAKPPIPQVAEVDGVAVAHQMANGAGDIAALAAAMQAFPHCDLQKGARNFVLAQGMPAAHVMILGDAPDRTSDREGTPFAGPAGVLLDKMLAAIDLSRTTDDATKAAYVSNILPWRPPADRPPSVAEIAMMMPFVARHIALADPKFIVLMGNTACQAILGKTGISRIRGIWTEALGKPVLPMQPPSALLRQPRGKRDAWADLLSLRARLDG